MECERVAKYAMTPSRVRAPGRERGEEGKEGGGQQEIETCA